MNHTTSSAPATRLDQIDPATGLPQRELAKEHFRRESVAEANADPLPGPLALAFPARPIRVGAFSIRPISNLDFTILRALNSPLIRQMAEGAKPEDQRQKTSFTDQEGYEMCLQFLLTDEAAEAEIVKGVEHFRALAREKIGRQLNPVLTGQIIAAVAKQFEVMFQTALQFNQANAGEPVNEQVFTQPPAAPRTASAGGSKTLPA
jgi:hypothetical protein